VLLEVYNLLGQRVKTLVDEKKSVGYFKTEWQGNTNAGEPVASGMYIIRFKAGDFQQMKKMMIVR
jgi:flagellar hook assembly protein FlgD